MSENILTFFGTLRKIFSKILVDFLQTLVFMFGNRDPLGGEIFDLRDFVTISERGQIIYLIS